MRPNQQNNKNRQRGRNNNGGRKHINPLSRNFESNGPDVKVRGNAAHIAEKYLQLARDAQSSGDSVMAENYLQHAEHYFRILAAAQPQIPRPDQAGGPVQEVDEDDDFPPINDRFSSPEPRVYQPEPQFQPQQQPQAVQQQAAAAEGGSEPVQAPVQANGESAPNGQQQGGELDGEGRRHRDRRGRRGRGRANGDGAAGGDPANSPQPEVDLPAFITAGGGPSAAE